MKPADITLNQLGRDRLVTMCGARNFMSKDNGNTLSFRVPATLTKKQINYVEVKYMPGVDEYTMVFGKIRAHTYKVAETHTGIQCTQLRQTFTEVTGLALSLGGH